MITPASDLFAIRIIVENRKGVLRDISTVLARHDANVMMIHQETFDSGPYNGLAE
ncbi:MAG TPA: ACT domain-containing protein, partial [Methanoregulaceae archaeon]|nr:ACT domain-containing protein [Methanoregulaceae archaeon]